MANGLWQLHLRLELLALVEASHRLLAIVHYSISEQITVPFLQLAMRDGYFCMSV